MLEALAGHEPAAALTLLEQSASEGVQPAELLSGLIDLVRDAMILAVGGGESLLLAISPRNRSQLKSIVERWTGEPIIAALQILGECRSRMRGSVHGRLLLETALVRAALLEELTSLSLLVERLEALESGTAPRRAEPSGVRIKPSSREATPLPTMTAPAPEADGTRRVPATAEAQTTPMTTPAPAQAEPRPRAPIAEAMPARAESHPGEGDAKTSRGSVVAVQAGATPDPPSNEVTRPIVGARTESPDEDAGARADAVDGVADRAVPEPPAATALDLGGGGAGSGFETEPTAARDAATAEPGSPVGGHHRDVAPLDLEAIRKLWPDLVKKVDKRLALTLTQVEPIDFEGTDVLVIAAKPGYNSTFADVDSPDAQSKIAQALQRLVHRPVRVKYVRRFLDDQGQSGARRNEAQRADSLSKDPLVQRVLELFEARPVQMDYDEDDASAEN
jgi:DNA polymerase-3 subunit gamma/tau